MPQVQVFDFPDKPNRNVESINNLLTNIGRDYRDKTDRSEIGRILDEYSQNANDAGAIRKAYVDIEKAPLGPTRRLQALQSLGEMEKSVNERTKTINAQLKERNELLEKQRKEEREQTEKTEKLRREKASVESLYREAGYGEEEAKRMAEYDTPEMARSRVKERGLREKTASAAQIKAAEKEETHKVAQDAFNTLVELVPKAGVGTEALSVFGGENARTSGRFQSSLAPLESILKDKVSKGPLSNVRFDYITEQILPKVTDPQQKIVGKLEALSSMLGLDRSQLNRLLDSMGLDRGKSLPTPPEGKVWVYRKDDPKKTVGSITPYAGMEDIYDFYIG